MSLLPYYHNNSMVPLRGTQDLGMTNYDPFSGSWMHKPLIQRTIQNARNATQGLQPILVADILDRGDKYEVLSDLPGVSKADLEVTIAHGSITIKGERRHRVEEEDLLAGTHRIERTYGRCSRTLQLPLDCDTANADCSFENGELKVSLPKLAGVESTTKLLKIA